MIRPNNPRISAAAVEEQVAQALARRRSEAIRPAERAPLPAIELRLSARQRLKRLRVIGPVLTFLLARGRRVTATGVGVRERLKAVPVLGDLLTLIWAVTDLPRFRTASSLRLDALASGQARDRALIDGLGQALALLSGQLQAERQALRAVERQISALPRPITDTLRTGPVLAVEPVAAHPAPPILDAFYLAFEAQFRGAREDIKERQRPYLKQVRSAVQGVSQPVCVDIGCGRGEWLELLSEQGLSARGIDLNGVMVQACQDRQLDALRGDGVEWLRSQPAGSVNVVTAFQVIEHLHFSQLIELLDATLHALAPTGVAIFETPNPENLQVGACNFYYDPTHQHPIAPAVAAFVAEQRGFARVEILRLNPYPDAMWLPGEDAVTRRLNPLLYGPQDYALIVGKQHAG